jgi:hypothetical protein
MMASMAFFKIIRQKVEFVQRRMIISRCTFIRQGMVIKAYPGLPLTRATLFRVWEA